MSCTTAAATTTCMILLHKFDVPLRPYLEPELLSYAAHAKQIRNKKRNRNETKVWAKDFVFQRLKSFGMWLLLPSFNQCLLFVYFLTTNCRERERGKKREPETIFFFLPPIGLWAGFVWEKSNQNGTHSTRNQVKKMKQNWLDGVVFCRWNMPRWLFLCLYSLYIDTHHDSFTSECARQSPHTYIKRKVLASCRQTHIHFAIAATTTFQCLGASRLFIKHRNAGNWVSFRRCRLMCVCVCWFCIFVVAADLVAWHLFTLGILLFLPFHYSTQHSCSDMRWRVCGGESLNDNHSVTHKHTHKNRIGAWIFIRDVLSADNFTEHRFAVRCVSMRKHFLVVHSTQLVIKTKIGKCETPGIIKSILIHICRLIWFRHHEWHSNCVHDLYLSSLCLRCTRNQQTSFHLWISSFLHIHWLLRHAAYDVCVATSSLSLHLIVSECAFLFVSIYCRKATNVTNFQRRNLHAYTHSYPCIQQNLEYKSLRSWTNWNLFPNHLRLKRSFYQFIFYGRWMRETTTTISFDCRREGVVHTQAHIWRQKWKKNFVESTLYPIRYCLIRLIFSHSYLVRRISSANKCERKKSKHFICPFRFAALNTSK